MIDKIELNFKLLKKRGFASDEELHDLVTDLGAIFKVKRRGDKLKSGVKTLTIHKNLDLFVWNDITKRRRYFYHIAHAIRYLLS